MKAPHYILKNKTIIGNNIVWKKIIINENIILKGDNRNNWILTKEKKIIRCEYLINRNGTIWDIYGREISNLKYFYGEPECSAKFDIYEVENIEDVLSNMNSAYFELSVVYKKLFAMKYRQNMIFSPLRHAIHKLILKLTQSNMKFIIIFFKFQYIIMDNIQKVIVHAIIKNTMKTINVPKIWIVDSMLLLPPLNMMEKYILLNKAPSRRWKKYEFVFAEESPST